MCGDMTYIVAFASILVSTVTLGCGPNAMPLKNEDNLPQPVIAGTSLINSIGMQFRGIPAGQFLMGSPYEESGARHDEEPHEVRISNAFYMGVHEVTQGHYQQVMGANPSYFQKRIIRKTNSNEYPVDSVTWYTAMEFCRRLSAMPEEMKAGRVYRLPTEAEWEYACRAGTVGAWACGDDENALVEHAWLQQSASHPVGQKKPNSWGIQDMHGNVSEWCYDLYAGYPVGAVVDPVGPLAPTPKHSDRVVRGGSIQTGAIYCRSAARHHTSPKKKDRYIGFRIVLVYNVQQDILLNMDRAPN